MSYPLSFIINLSLRQSMVPSEWKVAFTQIHKSVLKTIWKQSTYICFINFVENFGKNCTQTAIDISWNRKPSFLVSIWIPSRMITMITKFIDSVRQNVFDTLSHSKLLAKLLAYGIVKNSWWNKAYQMEYLKGPSSDLSCFWFSSTTLGVVAI